jgi:hypothetical protein
MRLATEADFELRAGFRCLGLALGEAMTYRPARIHESDHPSTEAITKDGERLVS